MQDIPEAALTDLIGAIYDCALEPERWPEAMARACAALECVTGRLMVVDIAAQALRFGSGWNEPPGDAEVIASRFSGDVIAAARAALADPATAHDPDTPFVISRNPGGFDFMDTPVGREFGVPLGWCDAINAVVLRDGPRIGVFAAVRHRDVGIATDREVALMRLLTPHFRRAVAIGDLLDMRRLEMAALAQTLDGLAVGVGIAAADGALLHANAAAQAMLASGGPLRLDGGRLAASRAEGTAELRAAIAATEGPGMGPAGIGVALNAPANPPAVAHVLPLIASGPRRRPEPRAAAAVFVREAARSAPPGVEAVAAAFGLTPAEARLLERLVAGAMLAEAAAGLGIAATTAKTQLAQIFAKAGVSRQAELLALVERLVPPVRQP